MANVTYIDKSKLETLGSEIRRLYGIEEKKTIAELTELTAHYQEDTGYIDGTITEAIDYQKMTNQIGSYAFYNCSSLQTASFPVCTVIGNNAFYNCTSLSALIIKTSNCTLSTNVFSYTPMSDSTYLGYYGSIYVPQSYVSLYKTKTNWVAYSNRITAIEGSPFEEVE